VVVVEQGGMTPHVSPLIQPSDCGSLLQAAGFTLPTVDVNTIKVFALKELAGRPASWCFNPVRS
jgi:hypothetical protein